MYRRGTKINFANTETPLSIYDLIQQNIKDKIELAKQNRERNEKNLTYYYQNASLEKIEFINYSIVKNDLVKAVLNHNIPSIEKILSQNENKVIFIVKNENVEKDVIYTIRALFNNHKITLVKAKELIGVAAQYIDMSSEKIAQTLTESIQFCEKKFAQILIKKGADINFNNGETLKLFINGGDRYIESIKLALTLGAKVSGEIKELAKQKGIFSLIEDYIKEIHENIDTEIKDENIQDDFITKTPNEKMKLLLNIIQNNKACELKKLVEKTFPGEEEKFLNIAKGIISKDGALENLLNIFDSNEVDNQSSTINMYEKNLTGDHTN